MLWNILIYWHTWYFPPFQQLFSATWIRWRLKKGFCKRSSPGLLCRLFLLKQSKSPGNQAPAFHGESATWKLITYRKPLVSLQCSPRNHWKSTEELVTDIAEIYLSKKWWDNQIIFLLLFSLNFPQHRRLMARRPIQPLFWKIVVQQQRRWQQHNGLIIAVQSPPRLQDRHVLKSKRRWVLQ